MKKTTISYVAMNMEDSMSWENQKLKYIDNCHLEIDGKGYRIVEIPYKKRVVLVNENKKISIDFEINKKIKDFIFDNYPEDCL